jgi:hypothetical protein
MEAMGGPLICGSYAAHGFYYLTKTMNKLVNLDQSSDLSRPLLGRKVHGFAFQRALEEAK